MPHGITQCYLLPYRGENPAFTQRRSRFNALPLSHHATRLVDDGLSLSQVMTRVMDVMNLSTVIGTAVLQSVCDVF